MDNLPQPPITPPELTPASPAPAWRRYMARCVDVFVSLYALCLLFGIFSFGGLFSNTLRMILSMGWTTLMMGLWVPIEAWALSSFGTTPGKLLLQIKVRNADGSLLTFNQALKRSWNVYLKGQCLGIQFGIFITQIVSANALRANGITSWDKEGNFVVTAVELGLWRKIAITVIILIQIALFIGVLLM